MQFNINKSEMDKISHWLLGLGYFETYHGAIDGAVTFTFTPTNLGIITKAKYKNEELDLTEYDSW